MEQSYNPLSNLSEGKMFHYNNSSIKLYILRLPSTFHEQIIYDSVPEWKRRTNLNCTDLARINVNTEIEGYETKLHQGKRLED